VGSFSICNQTYKSGYRLTMAKGKQTETRLLQNGELRPFATTRPMINKLSLINENSGKIQVTHSAKSG